MIILSYKMAKLELKIKKRTLEGIYILIGCMFMGIGTSLFLLPFVRKLESSYSRTDGKSHSGYRYPAAVQVLL